MCRLAMRSEQESWWPHAYGTIDLLVAVGPKICEHELGAALFHQASAHAVSRVPYETRAGNG